MHGHLGARAKHVTMHDPSLEHAPVLLSAENHQLPDAICELVLHQGPMADPRAKLNMFQMYFRIVTI